MVVAPVGPITGPQELSPHAIDHRGRNLAKLHFAVHYRLNGQKIHHIGLATLLVSNTDQPAGATTIRARCPIFDAVWPKTKHDTVFNSPNRLRVPVSRPNPTVLGHILRTDNR